MRDVISETLKKYSTKSKVNVKALQRYFRMKFKLRIEEEALSRRMDLLQK